jgi:hypothetical protein
MRTNPFLVLIAALVLLVLNVHVCAQDFWVEKPYKYWTREEIIKIISDSPWAQVREVEADANRIGGNASVTVRLRSALPIRQALVRLRQLEARYDEMNEKQRAEFDEKLRGTLECPACNENYVITVSPPISNVRLTSGVYGLKAATLKLLQGKVYLINDKGEKRELVHFVAPKNDSDEAVFFFPRFDGNGNSFLSAKNERFTFVFDAENVPITGGERTTTRRIVTDGLTPVDDKDTIGTSIRGRTVPRQVVFGVSKLHWRGSIAF